MKQPRNKNGRFGLKKERLDCKYWIDEIEPYFTFCKENKSKMTYEGFIKFMGENICLRTFKTAIKENHEFEYTFKKFKNL